MQNLKHRSRMMVFIAVLASFFILGLGQIMGGRLRRGLWQMGLLFALFFITEVTGLFSYSVVGIISFIIVYILRFYSAYDAYKINNNINGVSLSWFNKWYYYLIFGICFFIMVHNVVFSFDYKGYRIPTDSGSPTLEKGDEIIAKMNSPTEYKRNSLVIFPLPNSKDDKKSELFVKRIVAVEGETIAINNHTVYVNNKPLSEPYVLSNNNRDPYSENFSPHLVPKGYVFVLGDNRDQSDDSRHFGDIRIDDIKGKALYIFLSKNPQKIGQQLD